MGLDWQHPEERTKQHHLASSEVEELAGDTPKQLATGHLCGTEADWIHIGKKLKEKPNFEFAGEGLSMAYVPFGTIDLRRNPTAFIDIFLVGVMAKDDIKMWCKSDFNFDLKLCMVSRKTKRA